MCKSVLQLHTFHCQMLFASLFFLLLISRKISCASPQVLTLRLLRAILPAWESGRDVEQQERLVDRLFRLLGRVLVLCSSPFIQPFRTGGGIVKP